MAAEPPELRGCECATWTAVVAASTHQQIAWTPCLGLHLLSARERMLEALPLRMRLVARGRVRRATSGLSLSSSSTESGSRLSLCMRMTQSMKLRHPLRRLSPYLQRQGAGRQPLCGPAGGCQQEH